MTFLPLLIIALGANWQQNVLQLGFLKHLIPLGIH
jgi:hypothetical protein